MLEGKPPEDNWRQKYLSAIEDHDKSSKQLNTVIKSLRLGLSRISVAADGIDPNFDRQLAVLRRDIRSGANNEAVNNHIKGISKTLLRLDDVKNKG